MMITDRGVVDYVLSDSVARFIIAFKLDDSMRDVGANEV